jgi:Tol biopolymer transport system component
VAPVSAARDADTGVQPATARIRWRKALLPAILGLATLAFVIAGIRLLWRPEQKIRGSALPVLSQLTSDPGLTFEPAVSGDGRLVVYASDRQGPGQLDLWLQHTAGGDAIRLTRHPSDDYQPSWSPDGSKVVFRSDRDGGGIYSIPVFGGAERLLVERGYNPRISPDGRWMVYRVRESGAGGGQIYVIPTSGGPPRCLATGSNMTPLWSPDGKHVLLWNYQERKQKDWRMISLESGESVATGVIPAIEEQGLRPSDVWGDIPPGDWLDDYVYFAARLGDSTNIWRVRLDLATRRVAGHAERVTFGSGRESQPSVARSPNGTLLLFASVNSNDDIWSVPLDSRRARVTGEASRLTDHSSSEQSPSLSLDGKVMAFRSSHVRQTDIWVKDLTTGKETPLTETPDVEAFPIISADGSKVVYYLATAGYPGHVVSTGGGKPEEICRSGGRPLQWLSNQRQILYVSTPREPVPATARPPQGMWLLNLASQQWAPVATLSGAVPDILQVFAARLSPDERWLSFNGLVPHGRQIFVAPFRGDQAVAEDEWIPIMDGQALDREPKWSPGGNLLYFLSRRDSFECIWAQRLHHSSKHPDGAPFPVFHAHQARLSIGSVTNVSLVGLTVVEDKMVFTMNDRTGNVWMAELPAR